MNKTYEQSVPPGALGMSPLFQTVNHYRQKELSWFYLNDAIVFICYLFVRENRVVSDIFHNT